MRQALVDYLFNAAWQLPLLALGALALSRIASISPRQRCWLWSGFLILALVLPLNLLPAAQAGMERAAASQPVALSAPPQVLPATAISPAPVRPWLEIDPSLAEALAFAFGLALVVAAARLATGLIAARRLVRAAEPFDLTPAAAQALDRFAARHGFRRPPVRLSREIASPVTVGVLSPVILVPDGFDALAPEQARAALLHEAAHIQRDDFIANLLCELAALPLAWHPAIYAIKAGLRQSRESAADELAARAMASPELYAQCLVSLARSVGPQRRITAALALFGRGVLEARVRNLLARRRSGPLAVATSLGAGLPVLAAIVAPALLLHVTPSFAQDRPVVRVAQATPQAPPPARPSAKPSVTTHTDDRFVVINRDGGRIRHDWVDKDGVRYTVFNDKTAEPTSAEQRAIEDQTRASVAKAQRDVERASREVARATRQTQLSMATTQAEIARTQAQVAAAQRELARIDPQEIARSVARAQVVLNDPGLARQIAAAQAQARTLTDGRVQRKLERAAKKLKDHQYDRVIIGGNVDDVADPPDPPDPPDPR